MRQEHKAGDKMFVDFTDGLSLVDHQTGKLIETQLFVGVWGHSSFTYAEAVMDQASPAWTTCHVRAFAYSGVAPQEVFLIQPTGKFLRDPP